MEPNFDHTQVESRILYVALELYKHSEDYVLNNYDTCLRKAEEIVEIEMNYKFQPTKEN